MKWATHPILKPPTDEEMANMEPAELIELHGLYHKAISDSARDPYRYGFVLPNWKTADSLLDQYDQLLILGGNRSAKTTYGARAVVKAATENKSATIVCFAQNHELSVLVQQSAIFDALPAELKQKTLGQDEYISFTRQNGFAGNSLILPKSGSRIIFKTYSQFTQNQTILEGLELGSHEPEVFNLGAWCDEYLGGPELLNTLVFRLATRNAKLLLTFTPIDGYTETVRGYLEGAETLETRKAELLNNRDVPYVQKCTKRDAAVIYFHTKDNPFGGYERVAKECLAKGDDNWTLTRAYGIPTKSYTTVFPKFDRNTNVVLHSRIPTDGVTRYLLIDPAGKKNWFMVWIAVDASDTWWVYREWPDINVGNWGEWRNNKWGAGEGCKGLGYGIRDYADLIKRCEEGETIFERYMDSRLGKASYQTKDGASCIIDELADEGIICSPAPGLDVDHGLQALQTKMAWNNKAPLDALNRPHFYISERCHNLLWAIQEYTGDGGPDEQAKDPIDVLRYAAEVPVRFIDVKALKPVNKFKRGY